MRDLNFYNEYNVNVISSSVDDLYAENAFFADPYHNVQGITAIEDYFLAMAEPTQSCKFDIEKSNDPKMTFIVGGQCILSQKLHLMKK